VAENLDLGRELRTRELDEHLAAAARLGADLGMDSKALAGRLRDIADGKDEKGQ
jgi:hypothetical protein